MSLIAAIPADARAADCAAEPPARRVSVLELYTSEGCSSCPPADDWVRGLDSRSDLAIIAFHVDYWDDLGWKDPWSDPRFSARQRGRSARAGARVVYTPDVVHDGRSRTDWADGWTPGPATERAPFELGVRLTAMEGRRLRVSWTSPGAPNGSSAWVAVTESGLASRPTRGENSGRSLHHAHVARLYRDGLAARGGEHEFLLPADVDPGGARVTVVIEDGATARPLHASSVPLGACASTR
jgi:hypothetical protein